MISGRVEMRLDGGYMRPGFRGDPAGGERAEARVFDKVCPGRNMRAPHAETGREHPTFGRYVSAWRARAVDTETRREGSSAGVLTALSTFLVETGRAPSVVGVAASADAPTRTVPVRIMSRSEALSSAGSRYAPVAVLGAHVDAEASAVGKPCEISALRAVRRATALAAQPILLSFFCAGVPSQDATDALIRTLGVDPVEATSLRYRGDGWPGTFRVESPVAAGSLSYEESWGAHLGKRLQWRCKICPDGTGADADVAVGDYWQADDRGFPVFANGEGESVAIARTARGEALLRAAVDAGVLEIDTLDLDDVARVQPLQVRRKLVLFGRLLGRWAAGHRVPRMRGYKLLARAMRDPRANFHEAIGAFARSAPQFLKSLLRRAGSGTSVR